MSGHVLKFLSQMNSDKSFLQAGHSHIDTAEALDLWLGQSLSSHPSLWLETLRAHPLGESLAWT